MSDMQVSLSWVAGRPDYGNWKNRPYGPGSFVAVIVNGPSDLPSTK